MKELFACADEYLHRCSWKDMALLKFCLFSMGILAGMQVLKKDKKKVRIVASLIFVVTYIPLMTKFLRVVVDKRKGLQEREYVEKCRLTAS